MLLNEHTSYDEMNSEGRAKSRLLPIRLAFRYLKGKGNELKSYTVNLKNANDYNILWKQLMTAGSKISIPKIDRETGAKVEMGPRSFAKALDILGIEDVTDLQDFIEDPVYREMLETEEKLKFSFGKEKRKELDTNRRRVTTTKDLAAIGIDIDGEGESWEWGNSEDDMLKSAPEGRDIWVIRAHEYEEGYPCMFLYPYEGNKITDYSTALDLFFMDRSKETGVIYDYYDPKKFNLLWVACPCTYAWFLKNPVPTAKELADAKKTAADIQANQTAIEDTDYDTYEDDLDYRIAEQEVIKDRNKLKRLVESYGKEDVLNFIEHLDENLENGADANIFTYKNHVLNEYQTNFGKLNDYTKGYIENALMTAYSIGVREGIQIGNKKEDTLNSTENMDSEDNEFDKFPYDEDQLRRIQKPYELAFKKVNLPFHEFIEDEAGLDDEGYIGLYPDSLYNDGPLEDEFIQNNWIAREHYIISPGLLVNEDEDVLCMISYNTYDSDDDNYQNCYIVDVDSPEDFAKSYSEMMNEINSSKISIIAAIKKYFTVLRKIQ